MKQYMRILLTAGLSGLVLAVAGCGGGGDDSMSEPTTGVPTAVVQPLPLPGPYAVACSNVAQDFGRLASGEDAESYWQGVPTADGTPRYASDLLTDPVNALSVRVVAPNDGALFGSSAGKPLEFVVLACYPTTADNPRADFRLPTGQVVPHMQTGAEPPLFADSAARYPIIAFSHGLKGSPISTDYLSVLSWLASYGYVVAAPFHGDPRFAPLEIKDLGDALAVLPRLNEFITLQALRPLSMSATLDLMLTHPQWRDHVDATQIGGFGASMGGETLMLMAGAELTTSPSLASTAVGADPRLKAAVGYVPYFGQPFLPAFGRDQQGLDRVTIPFLGISGTEDTTAPLIATQQGMNRLAGPRELVSLEGVKHELDVASTSDILTWSLTFLDAQVRRDPAALTTLSTMASVAGGGNDRIVIPLD